MSDLFFAKNKFVENKKATLVKPLRVDTNKFGRNTIEDVKMQMHTLNKHNTYEEKTLKNEDIQKKQIDKINSLNAFKEWNKNAR